MISDDRLKKLADDHDAAYEQWIQEKELERTRTIERYQLLNRALLAVEKQGNPREVQEIKREIKELEKTIHIKALMWQAPSFGSRSNPFNVKWRKQIEAERKKKFGW